jgi:hypothetical protein
MKLLRVLTAVALVGVAVVHLRIAPDYEGLGRHPLALTDQFYAQSAGALLLAVAVLVRPHRLVWLATVGFAVASLGGLVYSRYRCLPVPGFDGCFQETWAVRGAKPALAFEVATLVLSALALTLTLTRTPTPLLSMINRKGDHETPGVS